jgi:hypothetical protein
VFLQYLLGLRRLGWDVLFVDESLTDIAPDDPGLRFLSEVMYAFGLQDNWTVLTPSGSHGLSRDAVRDQLGESAFLLNVMGYLQDKEMLASTPRIVFLDIDPGFPQKWKALDLADVFVGHDDFVTIGERIGQDDCTIPTCGLDWITTKQPVVLDEWPVVKFVHPNAFITSIATWRGVFGPIDWYGRTYGLRVHEFRKFTLLPDRTGARFQLALDIDPTDLADRTMLETRGFTLVDPLRVAGGVHLYREYIQRSFAELCVAKNLYVASRGGWFSDRSACYLASGLPVLAQDTGLSGLVPTDAGLVAFSTLDQAVAAVESIRAEPERHRLAARQIAETYFSSDVVLSRLLKELGVS